MSTRRLAGRHAPHTIAAVSVVALFATSCDSPPQAVDYCATLPPPGVQAVVVDDQLCDTQPATHQRIRYQLPPGSDDDTSIVILGVGSPFPYGGYGGGYSRVTPASPPVSAAKRSALVGGSKGGSTITRGGLGVGGSSGGSSGG